MTITQDIDTRQADELPPIADDAELRALVYDTGRKQLILNEAAAVMQSAIEQAKKAYSDATAETTQEVTQAMARIERYAAAHRDRLFPKKNGKPTKTHKILDHELQYRTSTQVQAPENAAQIIKAIILQSEVEIMNLGECEASTKIAAGIALLERLIRQPEPELNKDAVKALEDAELRDLLAAHGIRAETLETFKLAFKFKPEGASA